MLLTLDGTTRCCRESTLPMVVEISIVGTERTSYCVRLCWEGSDVGRGRDDIAGEQLELPLLREKSKSKSKSMYADPTSGRAAHAIDSWRAPRGPWLPFKAVVECVVCGMRDMPVYDDDGPADIMAVLYKSHTRLMSGPEMLTRVVCLAKVPATPVLAPNLAQSSCADRCAQDTGKLG